ncbi:MAG TPA: MFS transporter [Bacilli bacterium]
MLRFGMLMDKATRSNFRFELAASVLFSFFNVVFNQFYVPVAILQGASDFQVGLLMASPAIGLLFSPLWANFSEYGNPKYFVIFPNLAARLLLMLPALFISPWMFVAVALLFQLFMGIQAPAYAALIPRIYPAELRGRLMGNVRVAAVAFMIPLAYIVGKWIDVSGPSGPFLFAAVTGAASVLLFFPMKEIIPTDRPKRKTREKLRQKLADVKKNKPLVFYLAATMLTGFGNTVAAPLYQIMQVDKLHLSSLEIGYTRVTYYVCLLLAYLALGWVIDKFSAQRALFIGYGACSSIPLLYGLIGNYPAVLVGCGLQGFSDATWDIVAMANIFRLAPGKEASVFGIYLLLFGFRGTIGPLLSTGLTHTVSLPVILLAAAALCWSGFFLLFKNEKKLPRTASFGV